MACRWDAEVVLQVMLKVLKGLPMTTDSTDQSERSKINVALRNQSCSHWEQCLLSDILDAALINR